MASIQQRINEDGSFSWRVQIRRKGFPYIRQTFSSEEEAKNFAKQTEKSYTTKNTYPRLTLDTFIERFKEEIYPENSAKYMKTHNRLLKVWSDYLGKEIVLDITSIDIERIADHLLITPTSRGTFYSPTSRLRFIAALSSVLSKAMRVWKWIPLNPCFSVDTKMDLIRASRGSTLGIKKTVDAWINEFKKDFIDKVLEYMNQHRLSEASLARKCNLPKTTIQNCLRPTHALGLINFLKICKGIGLRYEIVG